MVIPEGILAPDTELEFGYYKRSTDQLNISVDIFKSLGDDEKQEALSQIMELLYSVLSEFYKMTTDDKYTKFLFNSEISCLERLKKSAK